MSKRARERDPNVNMYGIIRTVRGSPSAGAVEVLSRGTYCGCLTAVTALEKGPWSLYLTLNTPYRATD